MMIYTRCDVMERPKYIENAIIWNRHIGENGAWVRMRDLNLIEDKYGVHYEPAYSGTPRFIIQNAYPYEEWMEKYVGTSDNLKKDKNFRYDY